MGSRSSRSTRAAAVAALLALLLTACTGLPTTGDAQPGEPLGASPDEPELLQIAPDPVKDAGPAAIVRGFIEAAITPADGWAIARKFLTPDFAESWRPSAGVLVDASIDSRSTTSTVEDGDASEGAEEGDEAEVDIRLDQVAAVDEAGAYSETIGSATLPFTVVKTDGQWRISKAPDGVVLDESRFSRVYDDYPLQYFDSAWQRLVPDVRWFPRRPATIATTITQSLIGSGPSPWLEPAAQSAFPADVRLAREAVPIDADQVAVVALTRSAQSLDQTTLARMRTQLEATLDASGVHVAQVRFTVDGRPLEAGIVKLVEDSADTGGLVLKDGEFGTLVGREVKPIPGVSDDVLSITQPIASIDVAADDSHAAVQMTDGSVWVAGDGNVDELDQRASLVRPSMDPYGYVWSVPAGDPHALVAWGTDVTEHEIAAAWPAATRVTSIRVSSEGARVAAIVEIGAERWIVVSAVIRDESGVPTELAAPRPVAQLDGAASGLVWLGPDRLGVLLELDGPSVLTQIVGGPGVIDSAPAGAAVIAGSSSALGARVLASDGTLFTRSGSVWRESVSGVSVLATRAGR
ncbi:LpqB family beta-propeller domain-containing protein [Streptomyces sp. AC495_CC817]|uniref:LpqB family beta-propeller domain-containing protein n=1 Tax=Streptomyces sp. AC495_CC817 TaxID=2823900 RepID=UPI001C27CD11|nr:LpqB family beta-propeller domain-containing protein [Streptomyces sp. AC495_CC817]